METAILCLQPLADRGQEVLGGGGEGLDAGPATAVGAPPGSTESRGTPRRAAARTSRSVTPTENDVPMKIISAASSAARSTSAKR